MKLDCASLLAELRSYVGLTSSDEELLSQLCRHAEGRLAGVADEFYAVVRMHEGALSVLKDEAQAERLHGTLQLWLGQLLSGPYDEAFVARHVVVGEVHLRVGLEPRYVVAAMSRVRTSLQRIAGEVLVEGASATQGAVGRACDLSLAIMLESYNDHLAGRVERSRAREQDALREKLDQRERVLLDALGTADVALLGLDSKGVLLVTNDKAAELTGYAQDELVDADVFALLFGERAVEMKLLFMGATRGSSVEVEAELRTRAGKARLVRWRASRPRGEAPGPPSSVVLIGIDVTNERELERKARQNERLAAAGTLAAGLAHEIRNPLNGASLHVSVLDRALASAPSISPAAREATDVLRGEIRRLSALVTDFLEVARPKPLARAECDLNDIGRSVARLLLPEADARKVTLRAEASPFAATADIDAERITQVLVNLVRNGLEAVKEGGQVLVRVRRLPHHVEVDVVDDGPGIGDPKAPVFDAFYTTKDRGTGLGLSIVQRIVTDHGGDVSFASRPGSTTFTVRLPAKAAQYVP